MKFNNISLEKCKYYFDWDLSGNLFWKNPNPQSRCIKGSVAGCFNKNTGYWIVCFESKRYKVHRILYQLYHNIEIGDIVIDHIDRNTKNNSIENLQLDINNQNSQNGNVRKNNLSTGVKNISKSKRGNYYYYHLDIRKNYKTVFSKCYRTDRFTIDEVIKIRNEKLLEFHGDFASFG